jgi:deazaflavin-dependent oxidoreductase (nitroreductase family)
MTDPNTDVIAEFRGNSGLVTRAMGGALAHLDLLLLHHRGRRSGNAYTTPMAYMPYQDGYLVLGSFAGAASEPQWVANIEDAADIFVEVGTRSRTMAPSVLRAGPQRDRLYEIAREHWPFVLDYEKKTCRPFPVVLLTPLDPNHLNPAHAE